MQIVAATTLSLNFGSFGTCNFVDLGVKLELPFMGIIAAGTIGP